MADNKEFKPTFKKVDKMTANEKKAYDQGKITARNQIKEKLGLRKPSDKK